MQTKLIGVAALSHLGLIRVQGADAAAFLQGQLTQDFLRLAPSEANLSACCSPQGRMLASFYGFQRSATEILLVCSRDILGATLQRLSRFVLRAQVKLTDVGADVALFGLCGDTVAALTGGLRPPLSRLDLGEATVVFLHPADGEPRALWLAPATHPAPVGPQLSAETWHWSEVRSGVAMITQPIAGAFVPQMLNYESVGGVSFKKGCYTGQEVVARSQFRGTLKRRAYLAHSVTPLKAGDEVFTAGDDSQPCGIVAQAAQAPSGGFDAIVCLQVSAFEASGVHLGGAGGTPLLVTPAPYPLLADI